MVVRSTLSTPAGAGPAGSVVVRDLYRRLVAAGAQVCVVRASQVRAPLGTLGQTASSRWTCSRHRTRARRPCRATVLHNASGPTARISTAIAGLLEGATKTLEVVSPYVTERGMIRRMAQAARRACACGWSGMERGCSSAPATSRRGRAAS